MTLFFVVVVVVANLKIGPIITDKLATATMLRVFFSFNFYVKCSYSTKLIIQKHFSQVQYAIIIKINRKYF